MLKLVYLQIIIFTRHGKQAIGNVLTAREHLAGGPRHAQNSQQDYDHRKPEVQSVAHFFGARINVDFLLTEIFLL